MITEFGFECTEDEIRQTTPEEDAAYAAAGAEYGETARAILATVRSRLTGREKIECETAAGEDTGKIGFDCSVIDTLRNQFAREIAAWKDGVTA
jgi:hypothetical protein